MHCIHCGAQIPDTAKFCTACGKPVQAAPAAPDKEPAVEEAPVDEPIGAPEEGSAQEPVEETAPAYTPPVNASEGYKAASAQLPSSYSNPNYSSQGKTTYTASVPPATNGLAIAGFVCSLIFIPVGLGVLTAIAGLILSILGIDAAKKLPGNKGRGLAIAGMIISAVRIVLILIAFIALIALLIRGAGQAGHEFINNWPNLNPYNF